MSDFAFEITIKLVENGFIIEYPTASQAGDDEDDLEVYMSSRIETNKADVVKQVKKVLDMFGFDDKTKK